MQPLRDNMDSLRPTTLCEDQIQTTSRSRRSPSPRPSCRTNEQVRAPSPTAKVDVDLAPPLPAVIPVKECVLRRKSRCSNWGFTLRGTKSGCGKDKWIYNCYVEGVSKNGPAEVSYSDSLAFSSAVKRNGPSYCTTFGNLCLVTNERKKSYECPSMEWPHIVFV